MTTKKKATTKAKASKKKPPKVHPDGDTRRTKPFDYMLPVDLTAEQLQKRGHELGVTLEDIDELHKELADQRKANAAAREPLERDRDRLAKILRTGKEEQDVKCEQVFDYDTRKATIVRLDTGEVVQERPLSDAEFQRDLFLNDDEAAADLDQEAIRS